MRVDVKWRREGGIAIASVRGRIDGKNANDFRELLEVGLGADDNALILDMEHVPFTTGPALRECLLLARRFPRNMLALTSLTERSREVVGVSAFDRLIPVYPSLTAAVQEFTERLAAQADSRLARREHQVRGICGRK